MYIKLEDILKNDPCKEGKELAIKLFAGRQRVKLTPELLSIPEVGEHFHWLLDNGIINLSHTQAVIARGNAWHSYMFARYIQGADIEAHAQVVLDNSGDSYELDWARGILRAG